MENHELVAPLIDKLDKDFSLEKTDTDLVATEPNDIQAVKQILVERIIEMMDRNYERFMTTLYRIDLDEAKVNFIISNAKIPEIPELLADMIIERQLQRIRTQIMYKQGKL